MAGITLMVATITIITATHIATITTMATKHPPGDMPMRRSPRN
jgi:hypothetical protein